MVSRAAPRLVVPSSATLPVTSSRTSGALVGESFDPLSASSAGDGATSRGCDWTSSGLGPRAYTYRTELVSEVSAPLSAAKWCDDRRDNT